MSKNTALTTDFMRKAKFCKPSRSFVRERGITDLKTSIEVALKEGKHDWALYGGLHAISQDELREVVVDFREWVVGQAGQMDDTSSKVIIRLATDENAIDLPDANFPTQSYVVVLFFRMCAKEPINRELLYSCIELLIEKTEIRSEEAYQYICDLILEKIE